MISVENVYRNMSRFIEDLEHWFEDETEFRNAIRTVKTPIEFTAILFKLHRKGLGRISILGKDKDDHKSQILCAFEIIDVGGFCFRRGQYAFGKTRRIGTHVNATVYRL